MTDKEQVAHDLALTFAKLKLRKSISDERDSGIIDSEIETVYYCYTFAYNRIRRLQKNDD